MKVLVLGGAGDMGSRAVEDLVASPGVTRVTIADRNARAAEKVAAGVSGRGASVAVERVDAESPADLARAMRGHDVAASALGPFHRFELRLVGAALEAGVDYASICDEWDAALGVFERYSESARDKGRTVLIGLGASPGATSVAARHLIDGMDEARRADIYCYQPLDAGGGPAVFKHMLHIISGETLVWRKGKPVRLRALSEERTVEFPRFGSMPVWNMGHAEPVTLPRFFPRLEEVSFFMGFGRGSQLFVRPARWGWFESPSRIDVAVRLISSLERLAGAREPAWGAIRVDVFGERDGSPAERTLCGVGQMREITGLSLSIGARMLAERKLTTATGGVFAPEACLDPASFIRAFAEKGIRVYEDVAMTRPLP